MKHLINKSQNMKNSFASQANVAKFIFLLLAHTVFLLNAQAQDTIVISPKVGNVIDSAEKVNNRILSYFSYKKFRSAAFIRTSDSTILVRASFKGDSVVERPISVKEYNYIKNSIEGTGPADQFYSVSPANYTGKMGDSASFVRIETTDGAELFGYIIKNDSMHLKLSTKSMGEISINKSKISRIEVVSDESVKGSQYWFENPNSTRYFVGPSAFNLKKGEGYYQNNYIFLNSVNVGITKNISMGAGFELLSTFGINTGGPIFYVTPKVGFKAAKNLHVGGGVLYASIPVYTYNSSTKKRSGLGAGFGVITLGDKDNNFTLGGGYGFSNNEWSKRPMITASGMVRIGRKSSLVTENWFYPQKEYAYSNNGQGFQTTVAVSYKYRGLVSYGVRFFGESMSVDLGFINNREISEFILVGIPYIDFVVKFGGKKS